MLRTPTPRSPGQYGAFSFDPSTPVVLLGGKENTLSLTRSFGRVGIDVVVSGAADSWGLYSRYCARRFPVVRGRAPHEAWERLLIGERAQLTAPHVVIPCSDDALEFVADFAEPLKLRHHIDIAPAEQVRALLDKKRTLELAAAAGVHHPRFWPVPFGVDFVVPDDLQLPVLVKPLNTFRFAKVFGRKFITVDTNAEDLRSAVRRAHDAGFEVSVTESIPGSDDALSSYYTYVDDAGECLFDFTKRVLRRYPVNMGGATYHETCWLPDTVAEGRKFFRETGFRGFGCIEFKHDARDGQLKIIEVNGRFTAAQELLLQANAPVDLVVYCKLTGQTPPAFSSYRTDLSFWYPIRDLLAYNQLRRSGDLDFRGWLDTLGHARRIHPVLDIMDLRPLFGVGRATTLKLLARLT